VTASQRILDALGDAKPYKDGHRAKCPAHDGDSKNSLSVRQIETQALVYCFGGCDTADVMAALGMTLRDLYDEPQDGARYVYSDLRGLPTRTVHRSPEKTFKQYGATKAQPELYRLPKVVEAVKAGTTVYVVEGEKDVHALELLGAVATTSPMGATNWTKVDPSPLYGAHVVVVPDKDKAGDTYLRDVLLSLDGRAASVRVVRAKVGKDAADHVAAELGLEDFVEETVPQVGRRARITWAADITMRPVVWAWTEGDEGRMPTGSLSIAAGREGTGKSTFGIWMAAQITRGTLPGSLYGSPRRVLYVAVEDSWSHTIAPRLAAAGADLAMVGRFDVVEDEGEEVTLSLPHDNRLFERAIREHSVAMVVLDPLMSLISERIDTHMTRSVRQALDPLATIADRTTCLLLGIAHHSKASGVDLSSLITGSGAFKDVPRSVFGFVRDTESEDRVMTQSKNSLGRDDLPSLKYAIEDAVVDTPEGPAHVGRLSWRGISDRTAQEILRDAGTTPEDRDERTDAASWLTDYLLSQGSEAAATDVKKAGAAAGFSYDALKRAKAKAGVRSRKAGLNDGWVWAIAEHQAAPAEVPPEPEGSAEGGEGCGNLTPTPFAPFLLPSETCDGCGWSPDSVGHEQNCLRVRVS
jgi:hypothetical protein